MNCAKQIKVILILTWTLSPTHIHKARLLTALCLKVRNEAEEPLWPRGETGGQTAGGSVVRMSCPLFMPHLSSH